MSKRLDSKNSSGIYYYGNDIIISKLLFTFPHHFFQEPVKKKGRTVTTGKVKEENSNFLIKPKTKKQATTKKENPAEKSRSVYLITSSFVYCFFFK